MYSLLGPEDEGNAFIPNIGELLPDYTASQFHRSPATQTARRAAATGDRTQH
jgi:hypothetical protein